MSHSALYVCVCATGSGAQWWAANIKADEFKQLEEQHFKDGHRLVDLEVENGNVTAVWHKGSGGQYWALQVGLDELKQLDDKHFKDGYRLVNLRVVDGRYTAVWHPGSGAQWWVGSESLDDLKALEKKHLGLQRRRRDVRTSREGAPEGRLPPHAPGPPLTQVTSHPLEPLTGAAASTAAPERRLIWAGEAKKPELGGREFG